MKPGGIEQPVALIQTIAALGPGLSKAHEAVSRLANGGTVCVMLDDSDRQAILRLQELGVAATAR